MLCCFESKGAMYALQCYGGVFRFVIWPRNLDFSVISFSTCKALYLTCNAVLFDGSNNNEVFSPEKSLKSFVGRLFLVPQKGSHIKL